MKVNFFMLVLILGLGISCNQDDELNPGTESPTGSSIIFKTDNQSIALPGDSVIIELKLSHKAEVAGTVSVKVTGGEYGEDFTTDPQASNGVITIDLYKNDSTAQLILFRKAGALQQDKSITLTLENASSNFSIGTKKATTVKLAANAQEEPNTNDNKVNFSDAFIHITENETQGYEVSLDFTSAPSLTSVVTLSLTAPEGFLYGMHFVTAPAFILNELQLVILPGVTSASFYVFPVDNNLVNGNHELVFQISQVVGELKKGQNTELTVRIEEDDQEQMEETHSIAELRTKFDDYDGEFWFSEDYYIEGIITSGTNVGDDKTVYIQDETGGIMLRFILKNYQSTGDKVRFNLKNASANLVNDQKAIFNIVDQLGVKIAQNQWVEPQTISFTELHSGDYDGQLVKIEGAHFKDADGVRKFVGNQALIPAEPGPGAFVSSYETAEFSNNVLPTGTVSVTGIVGGWGRILPQRSSHIAHP